MPKPRKRFGQHFLEPVWVEKVLEVIRPGPEDWFIEIGPGRGALTLALAKTAAGVTAVEIDRDLVRELRRTVPPNVDVMNADILTVDFRALTGPRAGQPTAQPPPLARVAGNLPYNISSPILFRLFRAAAEGVPLRDATLMLQREVADRVTASPGSKQYGPLAVFARCQARVRRALELPPGAFRPMPRVRSAIVQLRFQSTSPPLAARDEFEWLVRELFTRRRKTVLNALRPLAASQRADAGALLERAGIEPGRRPETLQVTELARLAVLFASETRRAVL